MNAVIMKHRGIFISTHLRSIWWLLKTLDRSVSIKSPSMKPLEERISTHLATWGNNGGGRGGMEQMTTESLHNHMINKELCRRYIFIYIYIRSVARKETLDVHQKNWVCHIYCQINKYKNKIKTCLLGINMLV